MRITGRMVLLAVCFPVILSVSACAGGAETERTETQTLLLTPNVKKTVEMVLKEGERAGGSVNNAPAGLTLTVKGPSLGGTGFAGGSRQEMDNTAEDPTQEFAFVANVDGIYRIVICRDCILSRADVTGGRFGVDDRSLPTPTTGELAGTPTPVEVTVTYTIYPR